MGTKVLLGLDGGGTYTRIAITDMDGNLLSYVEKKGASSLHKDLQAAQNVHNAVYESVDKAGCSLGDIVGIAAGVAGLDGDSDLEWARELTHIDGLECVSRHVNDAVVAHVGAFLSKPGIISISGTGSINFGITESGKHIRNYDFHHYNATAARFLSYDIVYRIIAGEADQSDSGLVKQALNHFGVRDLSELVELGLQGFVKDSRARDKQFGDFAPMVTDAAMKGSNLAMEICNQAAADIVTGIKLVGACFDSDTVSVALIGSVANSGYIKAAIDRDLSEKANKRYMLSEPVLPAVLGAIILAMELNGMDMDERILNNLSRSAVSIA